MNVKAGQPLFTIKQGSKTITFNSPVSGKVSQVNTLLNENIDALDVTPYERNWVCALDAENLDNEIKEMHIGKSAVSFFQEDIEKFKTILSEIMKSEKKGDEYLEDALYVGQLEKLSDADWHKVVAEFFVR